MRTRIVTAIGKLALCVAIGAAAWIVLAPQPAAACANCINCSPFPGEHNDVCIPGGTQYPWTWCRYDCVSSDGGQTYHPANVNCIPDDGFICPAGKTVCYC
jgi:hypothetical protein